MLRMFIGLLASVVLATACSGSPERVAPVPFVIREEVANGVPSPSVHQVWLVNAAMDGTRIDPGPTPEAGGDVPEVSTGPSPSTVTVPIPGAALSRDEAIAALTAAGWPAQLHEEALSVWSKENGGCWCTGKVGDGGRSLGAFQLQDAHSGWMGWWRWCGTDSRRFADPVLNASTALCVYRYDIERGNPPWTQWTVKP